MSVVRRALLAVIAAASILAFPHQSASAQPAPEAAAQVQIVGDSLTWSVHDRFPADWQVRAQNGRALYESMPFLQRAMEFGPSCVVVALGSNDVGQRRSRNQMTQDIDRAQAILGGLDCVVWTTVKVHGVSPTYGRNWERYATMWNTLLHRRVQGTILDWDAVARAHPGWFLGDGLHFTGAGRTGYRNFLVRGEASA
jgi:hypothetical protein